MVDTLISTTALAVLHAAQSESSHSQAEAINQALRIHDISLNPKAHKLGADFEWLASDVVNGTAFTLLCTPKPEQNDMLLLLSTLYSIERFSKKRLPQHHLRLVWRRRSDQRKIVHYRDVLRRQLVAFGLQGDMTIQDNFMRVQMVQGQFQRRAPTVTAGRLGREGEAVNNHIPLSDQFPLQNTRATNSEFLRSPAQQQPSPHITTAGGPPFSLLDPVSSLQTPYPTILGSQVTIFVIDQLIAHFPSITENHDSGNVTTTTMTGSANDSSFRSA